MLFLQSGIMKRCRGSQRFALWGIRYERGDVRLEGVSSGRLRW